MPTINTLGSLAATGVFHSALALTLKRLPFLARLASDIAAQTGFKGMPFNVAQTLKNYNATMTVSDRSATGTYAKQAGLVLPADGTFTLNKWPYISFSLTLTELNQMVDSAKGDARGVVIDRLMTKAFNAFANNIVSDFLAIITAANFPLNSVMPVATTDHKKLGSAVDVMLTNDTLMQSPDAILAITPYRNLANGLTAIANSTFNAGQLINTGVISEPVSGANSVTRFNLAMPADAANGVLFDPMSVTFANRIPTEEELPNDPVFQQIISDPATAFSVLIREAKDPMTGEVTRTLTSLYGFGVGLQNHLVRLTES